MLSDSNLFKYRLEEVKDYLQIVLVEQKPVEIGGKNVYEYFADYD